jgi:hypothetical protein
MNQKRLGDVVGPFAGQEPLPLLREVLDLLHYLAARHRFAFLSGIAAGTDLPFERGEDRARLPCRDAPMPNLFRGQRGGRGVEEGLRGAGRGGARYDFDTGFGASLEILSSRTSRPSRAKEPAENVPIEVRSSGQVHQ